MDEVDKGGKEDMAVGIQVMTEGRKRNFRECEGAGRGRTGVGRQHGGDRG